MGQSENSSFRTGPVRKPKFLDGGSPRTLSSWAGAVRELGFFQRGPSENGGVRTGPVPELSVVGRQPSENLGFSDVGREAKVVGRRCQTLASVWALLSELDKFLEAVARKQRSLPCCVRHVFGRRGIPIRTVDSLSYQSRLCRSG